MRSTSTRLVAFYAAFAALALAGPAAAQTTVTRTFVSGLGSDTGTCSRSAPCRSFAYAIGQTAAGGEIVALDPAGYGPVTITKAISLIGLSSGLAQITVPAGGNGIEVNASGAIVSLRGIEIDGGANGIDVSAVGSIDIGAVVIKGATNLGLNLNAGAATLHDSSITSGGSDAIDLNSGSLVATRVTLANNAGNGFFIQGPSSVLTIIDSKVTGSTVGVDTRDGLTFIKGTVISNSSVRGVNNDGGTVYIDTTTVFGSGGTDVNLGTGQAVYSYRNNNFGTTGGTITPISPN